MALVKVKPTSAGRRAVVKVVNKDLHKGKPVAALVEKKNRTAGRNNNGHITTRHMGGGHKKNYRVVDFRRNKDGVAAKVLSNLGVELNKVRSAVEFIIGRGETMIMGEIGLTHRGAPGDGLPQPAQPARLRDRLRGALDPERLPRVREPAVGRPSPESQLSRSGAEREPFREQSEERATLELQGRGRRRDGHETVIHRSQVSQVVDEAADRVRRGAGLDQDAVAGHGREDGGRRVRL